MDQKPTVSIVMPTCNRERYLRQAIDSCLTQSFRDFELIIVSDGSTDRTEEIVRSYTDHRVIFVNKKKREGSVACLNHGFAMARGEFLTWTSDDDFYEPSAIEVMVKALGDDTFTQFVYTHYNMVDEEGRFLRAARVEDPSGLDRDNYVGHCFLYRRKVYEAVGDYHAKPFLAEEYEYWLRIRRHFKMKRIPQTLYSHRLHSQSLTMTNSNARMQNAVAIARRPFIPAWKHFFLTGESAYYSGRTLEAFLRVQWSLLLYPMHKASWRLLVLSVVPRSCIDALKRGAA